MRYVASVSRSGQVLGTGAIKVHEQDGQAVHDRRGALTMIVQDVPKRQAILK